MAAITTLSVDELVQAADQVALSEDTGSFVCDDVVILKRSFYDRMTAQLAATVDQGAAQGPAPLPLTLLPAA